MVHLPGNPGQCCDWPSTVAWFYYFLLADGYLVIYRIPDTSHLSTHPQSQSLPISVNAFIKLL